MTVSITNNSDSFTLIIDNVSRGNFPKIYQLKQIYSDIRNNVFSMMIVRANTNNNILDDDVLAKGFILSDITIAGSSYNTFAALSAVLTPILYSNATASLGNVTINPGATHIVSVTAMVDPNGILVLYNTLSSGAVTYTLQNGNVYGGNIALLLPYNQSHNQRELIIPIASFVLTGSFEYTLAAANISMSIINDVFIGTAQNINDASINYQILNNLDLKITTSVAIPIDYYVRIVGVN